MIQIHFVGCHADYYCEEISSLYHNKYSVLKTSPFPKLLLIVNNNYNFRDINNTDIIIVLQDYDHPYNMKEFRDNILIYKYDNGVQPKILIFDTNIERPTLRLCPKIFLDNDNIVYKHYSGVRYLLSQKVITSEQILNNIIPHLNFYPKRESITTASLPEPIVSPPHPIVSLPEPVDILIKNIPINNAAEIRLSLLEKKIIKFNEIIKSVSYNNSVKIDIVAFNIQGDIDTITKYYNAYDYKCTIDNNNNLIISWK